jgi:hypothetical protein
MTTTTGTTTTLAHLLAVHAPANSAHAFAAATVREHERRAVWARRTVVARAWATLMKGRAR